MVNEDEGGFVRHPDYELERQRSSIVECIHLLEKHDATVNSSYLAQACSTFPVEILDLVIDSFRERRKVLIEQLSERAKLYSACLAGTATPETEPRPKELPVRKVQLVIEAQVPEAMDDEKVAVLVRNLLGVGLGMARYDRQFKNVSEEQKLYARDAAAIHMRVQSVTGESITGPMVF